jgi:uncharacterized membrane protein YebE (DUF533 family)
VEILLAQAQRDAKIDMLKLEEAECRSQLKLIGGGVLLAGGAVGYGLYKKYAADKNNLADETPGPSETIVVEENVTSQTPVCGK